MRKNITGISAAFALVTTLALAFTSCQKDQNNMYNNAEALTAAREVSLIPPPLPCGGTIPDTLKVPEGNRFALQSYAKGVQIYQVKQTSIEPATYAWVNTAPSATLYAKQDFTNEIGTHYGGPSWEFTKGLYKGEKVVGTKKSGIVKDPSAVPWLLLQAVDGMSSPGNKITYIQRVCTTGGLAPTTPATESNLGQTQSIPYTAVYLFYAKQ